MPEGEAYRTIGFSVEELATLRYHLTAHLDTLEQREAYHRRMGELTHDRVHANVAAGDRLAIERVRALRDRIEAIATTPEGR